MDQRVGLILLAFLAACSGSPASIPAARSASPSVRVRPTVADVATPSAPRSVRVRADERPRPALEYDEQAQSDQNYIENAERAVALYRQFIERAGSDPQYALAVRRSREQIQDLSSTLAFLREGMARRAGK